MISNVNKVGLSLLYFDAILINIKYKNNALLLDEQETLIRHVSLVVYTVPGVHACFFVDNWVSSL